MDKRFVEMFARLDAIEKRLEELTAVMTDPTKSLKSVAEKHQEPVKKATVKK